MTNTPNSSLNASRETVAQTSSGYLMLMAILAVLALTVIFSFSQATISIFIPMFGAKYGRRRTPITVEGGHSHGDCGHLKMAA